MSKIKQIKAREVLDSRGNPTVSVKVTLTNGIKASASVPSGASTGTHEALEMRDGDKKRYNGKGVLKAVKNVNDKIFPVLKNKEVVNLSKIDKAMLVLDNTENKSKLGANAILGVSMACARVKSLNTKKELYQTIDKSYKMQSKYKQPIPMMNIINGGAHADSGLDIQEFMIVPHGIKKQKDRVRAGAEIFHELKKILLNKKQVVSVGDEGGFAPKLNGNTKALELIVYAIRKAGYKPGKQISIALDVAASEFYNSKTNLYELSADKKKLNSKQMVEWCVGLVKKFPIISIEDGMAEDDWEGWQLLNKKLGKKIMIVGDDFLVTNIKRLKKAIKMKSANSILIKLNQIGSLTETIDCIKIAKKAGWKTIISHRSGETGDTFIADLAVATDSEYIKTGSLCRSERIEKYNRLMEIEEER